ncbi:MAG: DinB family protein [Actinomycetota bacterium]
MTSRRTRAVSSTRSRKRSISPIERRDPPLAGDEKETLVAFLDYHRDTLLMKIDGVSDDELRRRMTPTGLSLLGLVKHLAYVERWWFQKRFADRDVTKPSTDDDPDADFRIEPHESTREIVDLYKQECAISREIIATASLDDLATNVKRRDHSLRWMVVHMIEETARHNGHADIMREAIDGVTGE